MKLSNADFLKFLTEPGGNDAGDSAHDIAHIRRVVNNAEHILQKENADHEVVITAAWLHDCVTLPKNHPNRKKASQLAAEKASEFLRHNQFSENTIGEVAHAIEGHSFSAGIQTQTIEAEIVQDADRLDALGAIGIARCFLVGGSLNRDLYNTDDPFCANREPDDSEWTIDHFYKKLLKLPGTMNTPSARKEAERRARFMITYLEQLRDEID